MPTYAYQCNDCNTQYEVFHKTYNEENAIRCPNCESENSKKLMTAASISGFSSTGKYEMPQSPTYSPEMCKSGMCGMN